MWQQILETIVCKPEAAPILVAEALEMNAHNKSWVGVGSGWTVYGDVLKGIYVQNLINTTAEITPTARAILELSTPIFLAGLAKPARDAMPIYIRNRVALTSAEREQGQRL